MRCLVAPADLLSVLGMHACVCAGKCLPALPVHAMGPMAWAKPNCLRVCIVWNWHTKSVCVAPCCSAEDTLKLDFTTDSLDQPDPFGHKAVVPADVVDAIRRVGVPRSLVVLLAVSCWQVVCCPQRQGCHLRTRSLHSCDREKKGYKFWWVPVHPWWPKLLPHSWQAQRSLQGLAQARVP